MWTEMDPELLDAIGDLRMDHRADPVGRRETAGGEVGGVQRAVAATAQARVPVSRADRPADLLFPCGPVESRHCYLSVLCG
jgi:hypothetical protein